MHYKSVWILQQNMFFSLLVEICRSVPDHLGSIKSQTEFVTTYYTLSSLHFLDSQILSVRNLATLSSNRQFCPATRIKYGYQWRPDQIYFLWFMYIKQLTTN